MIDKKFSWVQTHKELVEYLKDKESEQKNLVGLLRNAGVTGLHDEEEAGSRKELTEIDPFTFFCFIYKYGEKRRLEILQNVARQLKLSVPEGESGIPSAQAQKVMMFPFAYDRNNNEIASLWKFFYDALTDSIDDFQYNELLNQYGVGPVKITEGLFYIDPEKYLPINGPIKPYLKDVLGIDTQIDSFTDYKKILKEVKEKTDTSFFKLSYEAWKWSEEQKVVNYWVFQGNPKIYDFNGAMNAGVLNTWSVSSHKSKIKKGDKIIFWLTGANAGCYALGEAQSGVYQSSGSEEDKAFYLDQTVDTEGNKVKVMIDVDLTSNPITNDEVASVSSLNNLNVGLQGTNLSATQDEYEALFSMAKKKSTDRRVWLYAPGPNAIKWEEFYNNGEIRIGWDDLGDLRKYSTKEEIAERLRKMFDTDSSKKNDTAANWQFCNEMSVGDIVIAKNGVTQFIGFGVVTGKYKFDKDRDDYRSGRTIKWKKKGLWTFEEDKTVPKTLTDISPYPDFVQKIAQLIGINELMELVEEPGEQYQLFKEVDYPLNTILYGPPGTGKTYNTISIAADIAKGPEESIESYQEAKVIFDREIGKTIEFITFHQNYSYEDFIQGLRPDIENNSELSFTREDGVFKLIADRALSNYKKSGKREAKKKSFNEVFEEFSQPLIEGEVEEIEVKMKKVSFFITHIGRSIEFRKASGGTQHTLSVKTLEEMYEVESTLDIQGLSSYYKPLLENLLELGRSETETELIERKNYVLIIDEINRANISRVFGELITLIEDDKRYDGPLHIPAKLPSGERFSVPPNLFIIGTMNTADKSISLLDIALRRRFTFQAMYPDASLVKDEQSKMVLEKLNTAIIELKGHDFQIGHSYFMKDKRGLVDTMNLEVIPLLLEYFMNDRDTVEKLLKDVGFELKERVWPIQVNGIK